VTRIVVIINPVSGPARRGRADQRVQIAAQVLGARGLPFDIQLTERAGHAHELALDAASSGAALVIAWGGDGTINEVARALVQRAQQAPPGRHRPALGIVPGGSGNGLARDLRIPFDPAGAIEHALGAPARDVDAGELGDRFFFNVAGIGLDAHVAALVSTRVHHRGLFPYLKATARDLLRYAPIDYSITANGRTFDMSALFVAFANAREYGFGARIAPKAVVDDGVLDMVIVEHRRVAGNIARIPFLFLSRVDKQDGIHTQQVREVTIRSRDAMLFHVDGEAVQGSDTLVARVHPGVLRLQA
jgi:YegS/Rv2252/BmrU family lipid kinase